MVPLPFIFDARGYRFEKEMGVLKAAFSVSMAGALAKSQSIHSELSEYQESLQSGGKWVGERDEEGYLLWDLETLLEIDHEESAQALAELRNAFILAIYHYWERTIRLYCETSEFGHDKLVKLAKKSGVPIIEDQLKSIHLLANVLKHNSDEWGHKLRQSWPEVFRPNFEPAAKVDWYSAIELTDQHVSHAFDVIQQSGPKSKQPRKSVMQRRTEMARRFKMIDLGPPEATLRKSAEEIVATAMLVGLTCSFVGGTNRFLNISGGPDQVEAFNQIEAFMESIPRDAGQMPESQYDPNQQADDENDV